MSEINEETKEEIPSGTPVSEEDKSSPAAKRITKKNIRKALGLALAAIFCIASIAAVLYILDDANHLSESGKRNGSAAAGMLSPRFVPNSVKYASKEDVRVYVAPEPKKTPYQTRIEKEKESDIASSANKNSDGTSTLLPPYLKSTRSCENVNLPKIYSLTKNDSAIQNLGVPAYWKAFNNTEENIAIIISQDSQDIAVVFLPPHARFETRVPATELSFAIRHTKKPCIEWNGGYSAYSKMPALKESDGGDPSNLYRNAIFETAAFKGIAQIEGRTKLIGYAQD